MSDQENKCSKCGAVVDTAHGRWIKYHCGSQCYYWGGQEFWQSPVCKIRERDQLIAVLLAACLDAIPLVRFAARGEHPVVDRLQAAIVQAEVAGF